MKSNVKQELNILNLASPSIIGEIIIQSLTALVNEGNAEARVEGLRPPSLRRRFTEASSLERLILIVYLIKDTLTSLWTVLLVLKSFYKKREEFVSDVLGVRFQGILVGDCIVSAFFRNPTTPILPDKSYKFLGYLFASIPYIGYQIRYVRNSLSNYNNKETLFFSFETTGYDEVIRRYLITSNYREIRYSELHQGFRVFKGFTGVDLRKSLTYRRYCYETFSPKEIAIGRKKIHDLVERKIQYSYLKDHDVRLDMKLKLPVFTPRRTVILFLATLSDAQYLYGRGPFGDLHGFQEGIIKWGLATGLNVVVKPHPGMYKDKDYTLKDRKYFEKLKCDWRIKEYTEGIERSEKESRLYFVDSKFSVKELSRVFPDFLCATQHGSVAAECAFLGHLGLVATNSQFFSGDRFVSVLRCKKDLAVVLDEWYGFKGFNDDALVSLYKYSFLNNVKCQPLYASRIFKKTIPTEIDSAYVENWLADFLKVESDIRRADLVAEAIEFFSSQNNDFEITLNYEE
ncbi:MAG: hypothetical protein HRU04_09000 [Oceanospirillaceae bacterium]|nr:hypothetical protein [Oceanospirillaceae bacterium]